MKLKNPSRKKLKQKAQKGFRGYPIATIAFYGPDNKRASKVAVGIITREDSEPDFLERWYAGIKDARSDFKIQKEILDFIRYHKAKTVSMVDKIIGCPHEEGIDYPEDEMCPQCPYWMGRDRWTGMMVN